MKVEMMPHTRGAVSRARRRIAVFATRRLVVAGAAVTLSSGLLLLGFLVALAGAGRTRAAAISPVPLGTAKPFAILAGSSITDVPPSAIKGDVGLSPSGWVPGLTCAEVVPNGTIYSVDASGPLPCRVTNSGLLTTAKNDLTTAFTNAAGRPVGFTVPTELGGTTETPGVYDSASTTFQITAGAGPLVLNGQGDLSSVFIFEMNSGATGLTVGPGSTVSLINGAQACNVFWRLNTATIDTTAVFKGTILANTSITVNNGANIEGRLLARTGDVTLISDTITRPKCTGGGGTSPPTTTAPTTTTAPATTAPTATTAPATTTTTAPAPTTTAPAPTTTTTPATTPKPTPKPKPKLLKPKPKPKPKPPKVGPARHAKHPHGFTG